MIHQYDLDIPSLGTPLFESPLNELMQKQGTAARFVTDDRAYFHTRQSDIRRYLDQAEVPPMADLAGPRHKIYFNPAETRCAIVTCGGLCPGINDVIRAIVMTLTPRYGVKSILGILQGFRGFIPEYGLHALDLTPERVSQIYQRGGSILSMSRGSQNKDAIVDFLETRNIQVLFIIGGDGTMKGALEISERARKRNLKISVVGIPKTIDNDILYIDKSFGFQTAFSEAVKAIAIAHNESRSAPNGIGLVKIMGRHSGFIACYAALAQSDVNFVLIPEVPFDLEGDNGFLEHLRRRLEKRQHAVVLVAEGAGQNLFEPETLGADASGNQKFQDIGLLLQRKIKAHFQNAGMEINLKYIDPSYMVRGVPASSQDSYFCLRLAQNAVHGAMAGFTEFVVARRNNQYVYLPMKLICSGRRVVDTSSELWTSVLESTGQPSDMTRTPISGEERSALP